MAQARTTTRSGDAHDARISRGTHLRGRVFGEGNLFVEGHLDGPVTIRGDLTVADGAHVSSEAVEAQAVAISGAFEGNVTATGAVRLLGNAKVRGNLRGASISIEDGARYSGRFECEFELPPELGGPSRGEGRGRTPARR